MISISGITKTLIASVVRLATSVVRVKAAKVELKDARAENLPIIVKVHDDLLALAKTNKMDPSDKASRRAMNKALIAKSGFTKDGSPAEYAKFVLGLSRGWNYKPVVVRSKLRLTALERKYAKLLVSASRKAHGDEARRAAYTALAGSWK